MENQIFETGDRVFDIRYGWGKVTRITTDMYPIEVLFKQYGIKTYTSSGSTEIGSFVSLSFTEYTLHGFSQKRPLPIELDKWIGKLGKFWDENPDNFIIDRLKSVAFEKTSKYFGENTYFYKNFTPLNEEQIRILESK